jgi:hypothetical protein
VIDDAVAWLETDSVRRLQRDGESARPAGKQGIKVVNFGPEFKKIAVDLCGTT